MIKKRFHIVFKILSIIFLFFLTAFIITYAYLYFNKKEILNYINGKIEENINGKASIEDIDFSVLGHFPNLSIQVKEIHIQDSLYKRDLIYAKNIFLKISFRKLLSGELHISSITVKDCTVDAIKDTSGYTNLSVFKKDANKHDTLTKEKLIQFSIHTILFRNVAFVFKDVKKNKQFGLIFKKTEYSMKHQDKNLQGRFRGDIYVNGLVFKPEHGGFINAKNTEVDLNFQLDKEQKNLVIQESAVHIEGQQHQVSGNLYYGEDPVLQLHILNKKADYRETISILSANLQSKLLMYNIENSFSYVADLSVHLNKTGIPDFKINLETTDNIVDIASYRLDNASVKASFTTRKDASLPASDENAAIEIMDADFSMNQISCYVKGILLGLKEPVAKVETVIQSELKNIDNFLDNNKYQFDDGRFIIKAIYAGPINNPVDSLNKSLYGELTGSLDITNGHMATDFRNFKLARLNSHIDFNKYDASITSLRLLFNNNPLSLSGSAKRIVPYLLFPGEKMSISLNLYSEKIDLGEILSTSSQKIKKVKKETKGKKNVSAHLDKVMGLMSADFTFKIDKLIFKKLVASNLNGAFTADNNSILLKRLNMNFAQGNIQLSGKLKGEKNKERMQVNATLKKINVPSLFYAFNNFNQKTVQDKNLEGKLNSDLSFNSLFDPSFNIIPESMSGDIRVVLNNGSLKDLEPMKKISKIIFKNRDLLNIQFDRIDNRFVLKGNELYIKEMEINSSALTLSIKGVYSFKDKTDMSIRIPLKNLKKRKEKFYNMGDNTGTNILLRAKEKDGKVAISLDLFNKYGNKK